MSQSERLHKAYFEGDSECNFETFKCLPRAMVKSQHINSGSESHQLNHYILVDWKFIKMVILIIFNGFIYACYNKNRSII